jgi:histidyl-tRNA synthetase
MSEPPATAFQAPIGTQDVLAPESARWEALLAIFSGIAHRAGYGLIQQPVFEDIGVFQRLGEGTDVVRKEMYDFRDKGDRHLALRPEVTASVVRAFVQHRPTTPWKVWSATPCFRYESPQAGRYRQHHQVDVEAIGSADPDLDVEVIALGDTYLRALGLTRFTLAVNSMGTPDDRRAYVEEISAWLRGRRGELAKEDQEKVDVHPMRVLDSKRPETQTVVADAPRITDRLSAEASAHFERVQEGLRALGIDHRIEPRLVRGLDYYTHTTFEFVSDAIDAAQSTLLGGGRYDGLVEQLGGPPTPAVGFGSGIERALIACDAEGVLPAPETTVDVFVVDATDGSAARDLTHRLRGEGLAVDRAFDGRSMKSQMKAADRSGARFALIIGETERADGTITVRDLRAEREQEVVRLDDLTSHLQKILEERTT